MTPRNVALGCLLGALGAAALRVEPARGGEPDLGARIARVEEQAAQLQGAVTQLKETLSRNTSDAENLRLRMSTVEGYLQALQTAFSALVPGAGAPPPSAGAPVIPDGRIEHLSLEKDGNDEVLRVIAVSGQIIGLTKRARFELAVSVSEPGGLTLKSYVVTTGVIDRDEVVRVSGKLALSTDGDQDNWVRNLLRDENPQRRIRNLVVKFQILSVLPPPK